MPVQPDDRRFALLSDFASYVSTAALTALRGAPSGLATLGADGKVPTAQLPTIGAPLYTVLAASGTSVASTSTYTAAGLAVTAVPAGTYAVDLDAAVTAATSGSANLTLTGGATWRATLVSVSPVAGNSNGVGISAAGAAPAAGLAVGTTVGVRVAGTVTLTAAGDIGVSLKAGATTGAVNLREGSLLRLTRVA